MNIKIFNFSMSTSDEFSDTKKATEADLYTFLNHYTK